MIDWDSSLNEEQKEAVFATEGPLLILAGAGSGKTRVIAYRIAYLIQNKGIPSTHILAVTFTNKAARQMRDRIETLLSRSIKEMWVGTFHATCVRILRAESARIGFQSDFVIMDEEDQERVIKDALKRMELGSTWGKPASFLDRISDLKNEMISPADFLNRFAHSKEEKQFARLYEQYQALLKENNAFDFDDLLLAVVRLLSDYPDLQQKYRSRFRYVLVDEFQDINRPQYELVKLWAGGHRNLCVVGDDYQAIFSWRGADVRYLLDHFEKDFPAVRIVRLERNYRSGPKILDAANEVIANLSRGKEKRLWTEKADEQPPLVQCETANETEEAHFIVREIDRLVADEGRTYRDAAILYRMNSQSRLFEEVLLARGIPYRVVGGLRFYERKEIKDAIALLRFVVNPLDSVSLRRILAWIGGIGQVTVDRAFERGLPLYEGLQQIAEEGSLKGKGRNSLEQLRAMIASFRLEGEMLTAADWLKRLLQESGYLNYWEKEATLEAQTRLENLQELVNLAVQYSQESSSGRLEDFLAHIALYTDLDSLVEREDVVTLMTVHSAKGLEFPIVFLVGMEEGIFPHWRSAASSEEMDEERRLCYVAITRAQSRVYFSWARQRMTFGVRSAQTPSTFLTEIPPEFFGEKPSQKSWKEFDSGSLVWHRAWGEGVIRSWEGEGEDAILTIFFPTVGEKRLILRYAPLTFQR